jgi:hypothetical protein
MDSSGQIRGLISYMTKLTHTVDVFRIRFVNVEVSESNRLVIKYGLEITSKEPDIPYLWDFLSCKSKHIMQDGCEIVSVDWSKIFPEINDIYYNGKKVSRYGGNIPAPFIQKISNQYPYNNIKFKKCSEYGIFVNHIMVYL